ncbi:MAG: GNAT family N-acetyltransferase [Acidimicrobiales bacterium]
MVAASLEIRHARPGDGVAMARVHVRAWREGYEGLVDPVLLCSLHEGERAEAWEQRLLDRAAGSVDGGTELLVAVRHGAAPAGDRPGDDDLVGIATIGPERGGDGTRGEVWMLGVRPDAWGDGVGSDLLEAAEDELRRAGYQRSVLWVLEGNERARHFYEREGWNHDGAEKHERLGCWTMHELRYVNRPDRSSASAAGARR